jgi:hypothetical protein
VGRQHLSQAARAVRRAGADTIVPSVVISASYAYRPSFASVFLDATAVLAVTFLATVVAAIILPWRRKDLYQASPSRRLQGRGDPGHHHRLER